MEFITIFFNYGVYSENKIRLKKMMNVNGFKWNNSKMKLGLSNEEIFNAFKFFKVDNRIIDDDNLKGRSGSVGVWEVGENAVKIIMFDKKNDDEHLPVLLVYKGIESDFYKEFIRECVRLGCEIGKVIESEKGMEEIFKKRINVDLINRLNNVHESKIAMKEVFKNRVNELKNIGYFFSDSFINGWCALIDKYGYYTDKMLYIEIESKNKEREITIKKEVVSKIIEGNKFFIKRLLS